MKSQYIFVLFIHWIVVYFIINIMHRAKMWFTCRWILLEGSEYILSRSGISLFAVNRVKRIYQTDKVKKLICDKMIILKSKKIFRKLMGLQSFRGRYFRGYVIFVPILISFPMLLIILLSGLSFHWNINNDVSGAWPSLTLMCGASCVTTSYLHFLINRVRFFSLFDDIQDIVNESELWLRN